MTCPSSVDIHPAFFKVGATVPSISYRLCGVDLTGSTVTVNVRRPDESLFVLTPVIDNAAYGVFHTDFDATHLTIPGLYYVEVKVVSVAGTSISKTFALQVDPAV